MKFAIEKDELLKEIAIAQEIISAKEALSITSSVFIEASSDGTLLIRATNTSRSFETAIPADVEEEGAAAVFCDKLKSVLSSLPAGKIELGSDGASATVRPLEKKASFKLKTIDASKFPEIPSSGGVELFELPARSLKRMLRHTTFAVSSDEIRYSLNGVYAEKDGGLFKMAATDGKRLAVIEAEIEGAFPDFAGSIIPAQALGIMGKRCPDEGMAAIGFTEKNAFFRVGGREYSIRLIDGQFPNYRRVIPEKQSYCLTVARKDFSEALKRVGVLAEQKSGRVYLEMSQGTLKISARDKDMGDAAEFVDCEYGDEPFQIAANCAFLAEPVNAIECEKIRLGFTAPRQAMTIRGEGEDGYLHVVMPMQME